MVLALGTELTLSLFFIIFLFLFLVLVDTGLRRWGDTARSHASGVKVLRTTPRKGKINK